MEERTKWPPIPRKKLEEKLELKVLDVQEKPGIQMPVAGCGREEEGEMERLRDEKGLLIASVQDLSEARRRAEVELRGMRNKLQASDKEKSRLQYELHLLNKQLQIRRQEKEVSGSGEVEEESSDLFGGLMSKKISFNNNNNNNLRVNVWTSPDEEDDNEDDVSCAESWASALLSELDHFKPKQSQEDISVVSEIMKVIQPVALHLKVDTAGLVQAKEKVALASLQDHALLHFLQHLSSLLPSILSLSPPNAFSSDPTPQTLEIAKLHGQIQDLNTELHSQINQRQHLSALNEKLQKDLEAYRKEKNDCNINQCHKVREEEEEEEKKVGRMEQVWSGRVGGYEEKEKQRSVWKEEEEDWEKRRSVRIPLYRRLFLCASPKQPPRSPK